MGTNYMVLLGDIIGSKKLSDKAEVLDKLQKLLNNINSEFAGTIVSRFVITRGDELQGMLKPGAVVYRILNIIAEEMYPVKIRFGIGYGGLSTVQSIRKKDLNIDGPAFDKACGAIEIAHDIRGYAVIFKSELLAREREEEINFMLRLLAVIRNLWSDRFFQIVRHLRAGEKQVDIARQLGITQPYISDIIKQSCWQEVRVLEEKAVAILEKDFGK